MYLNLNYLKEKQISFKDVIVLQLAKQQKFEDCSRDLESMIKSVEALTEKGLLKSIKGKKSDPPMTKVRISKEGNEILSNIEIAEVTENDIILFDWMKEKYLDMGKKLGNQKKTKLYIALFRVHSGITENHLAYLMSTFLSDEANMEYNMKMEYALFKPQNVYTTKFSLEESRLYQYYLTHQEHFDEKFKEIG